MTFKDNNHLRIMKFFILFVQLPLFMASSPDFIINQLYQGTYQVSQPGQTFDYLDSRTGNLQAIFYAPNNGDSINSVDIYFLDPKYMDEKVVLLQIQGIIMINNNSWEDSVHVAFYTTMWNGHDEDTYISIMSSTITFSNTQSEDYHDVIIGISMIGSNLEITATLTYYDEIISTLGYSFYVTGVVAIQIGCAAYLLKLMEQRNIMNKISLITLSLCNFQDFSQIITHILYTMASASGFLFFVLPAVAYLVIFIMFDMKLLFLVWKSHSIRGNDSPEALRKRLTLFYIQFYVGLFIYITLNYFYPNDVWMVIVRSIFLFPQIIFNARVGNNPGFNPFYILGYVGIRLLIPLYNYSCPDNRFLLSPNFTLIMVIISIFIFEILLLLLQYKLGSRFFIPKHFLPNHFEYRQKIHKTQENKDSDCTICLQNIFSCNLKLRESLSQKLLDETVVFITPCGHKFHPQCLTEWIDVKLECPTCRSPIPTV